MARHTQLLQLVTMLRDETGRANSPAVGVDDMPGLKTILRRNQEVLYDEFDWPFLRVVFDRIDLQAGERFYDIPDDLNLERISEVAVWNNEQPLPVDRGIGFPEYARYSSEDDMRSDPVERWDIQRTSASTEQIEVWPIPASDDQQLQIIGFRNLRAMTANADVCDLDDQMIVLFSAAEILARQESEDAKAKLTMAQARFARLTKRVSHGGPTFNMGGGRGMRTRVKVSVR